MHTNGLPRNQFYNLNTAESSKAALRKALLLPDEDQYVVGWQGP